jgi:hypothetical protein
VWRRADVHAARVDDLYRRTQDELKTRTEPNHFETKRTRRVCGTTHVTCVWHNSVQCVGAVRRVADSG